MNTTMELDPKHVAKTLRLLRKARGFTQENLAQACNLSTRTIEKLEGAQVTPTEQTLRSLARGLGYEVSAFYKQSPAEEAAFHATLEKAARKTLLIKTSVVRTAQDILAVFDNRHAWRIDVTSVRGDDASEQAAALADLVTDWNDMWEDMQFAGRLDAARTLAGACSLLEKSGYLVHMGHHRQMQRSKNLPTLIFNVGLLTVLSKEESENYQFAFVNLEDGWETLPEDRIQIPPKENAD
jgi:transcriptional regulator with XRE-family HTH domain